MTDSTKFWLVKSEPESFSILDLAKSKDQTTCWDGVRNYQARNTLRDAMQPGDRVLYYHSGEEPAIVGTATVVRGGYPDPTAWDKRDSHYDAKSKPESPTWFMVDLKLEQVFAHPLALAALRTVPALAKMELLRKGSRLSVQPVRPAEFATILKLAKAK